MNAAVLMNCLSPFLFWDTSPNSIDPETHQRFVIVRVMERGTMQDVLAVWRYYGASRIREALLQAPALDNRTITYFAHQFNLPRSSFRAWKKEAKKCT